VFVREISLQKTAPIPARPVKVACSVGKPPPGTWEEHWSAALDNMLGRDIDIFLLPEVFNDCDIETDDGPAIRFMSEQAKRHKMYVAGTILYKDPKDGYVYNSALMYDRNGQLCARYDKNHPFSNELANMGVIPGRDVPVFDTDFGKVGIMICYDSWFTDVAELLGLKGAEIVLFPNAGYYRSLVSARAADNCIRIVSSSLDNDCGIWDTSGADVTCPGMDPTRHSKCDSTFSDVLVEQFGEIKIVSAIMDLSKSPSPHNWGGPMMSAPGGRRNRREQRKLLYDEIQQEVNRWWEE
jgi:predicted amidohydrolase